MKENEQDKRNHDEESPRACAQDEHVQGQPQGDVGAEQESASQAQAAEQPGEESVEQLGEQLHAAQDKYIRLLAEFDNFKRRTSREYERMVESATEKLMQDMVGVRENFERALKTGSEGSEDESFVQGMRLIYTQFDELLRKHGLEPFGEEGDEFDPVVHDAMMKMPHETIAEDHIAQVVERGYRLKGHVIKHARVLVSAGAPQGEPTEASNNKEQQTEAD